MALQVNFTDGSLIEIDNAHFFISHVSFSFSGENEAICEYTIEGYKDKAARLSGALPLSSSVRKRVITNDEMQEVLKSPNFAKAFAEISLFLYQDAIANIQIPAPQDLLDEMETENPGSTKLFKDAKLDFS